MISTLITDSLVDDGLKNFVFPFYLSIGMWVIWCGNPMFDLVSIHQVSNES
jgi:hypothetical protein